MTLILNNGDVQSPHDGSHIERAYIELTRQEAVCRSRIECIASSR